MTDTEKELEKIFISYNRILQKFKIIGLKTKSGKQITHKDLRKAIDTMEKKHPTCRWKCQRTKGYKHYILIEGFYWLMYVYFQNEKSLINADIDFFETRIKQYEKLLSLTPKGFFENEMYICELEQYFNRSPGTIKNSIIKMNHITKSNYKYCKNGKCKISKEGIEWLCKNCFKQKYLELLEKYKMELTEIYIERGYPYDIF